MKPDTKAGADLPHKFEFSLGALESGWWHEVTYTDNALRCRSGTLPPGWDRPEQDVTCTPDPNRWTQFWQTLDQLDVWTWKPDYTDPNVLDGEGWQLEIEHAGRTLKTGGDNGYPGSGDDAEYTPDSPFGRFLSALEKLTDVTGLT